MYRKAKFPSTFVGRNKSKGKAPAKIITYDQDIWCLPQSFVREDGTIPIPKLMKKCTLLCAIGLIGKIRLTSYITEEEIMNEIRSVFERPFDYDDTF